MTSTFSKLLERFRFIRKNDLFSKSVKNLSLQVAGIGLSYIAVYLISHVYNADVLGYYTLSNIVLQVGAMIVLLGMNTAVVKIVPGLFAIKNVISISSLIQKGIFHVIIFGIIISIVLYFSADTIAIHIFHKSKLGIAFKQVSYAIIPLALLTLIADFLRGCGKNILWAIIMTIISSLVFIVIFGILYFYHNSTDPIVINVVSYGFAAMITVAIFFSFIKKNNITLAVKNLNSKPTYNELKKISLPMFLFSSNLLIGGWISTFMVGMYGTAADTGVYRVVDRVGSICSLVLLAINAVLAPKIAAAFAKKDISLLKINVLHATKLIFWISLPIQFVLIVFHRFFLGIFGPEFLTGGNALLIILIGYVFNSLTGPVGQVLNMTQYQVFLRNVSFLGLILTIVLNYFLIPSYGIAGAAIASSFNSIFINVACVVKIKREFAFNTIYNPFLHGQNYK